MIDFKPLKFGDYCIMFAVTYGASSMGAVIGEFFGHGVVGGLFGFLFGLGLSYYDRIKNA